MDPTSLSGGEEKFDEDDMDPLFELSSSLSSYQRETASVRLVDITNQGKSPRMQLREMMTRKAAASQEVDKAAAVAKQWLQSHGAGIPKIETPTNPLVGRVKFSGPEPIRRIVTPATAEDLFRIQLNLVK